MDKFNFLALAFLVFFIGQAEAKKIPRWWLKVAQRQGPNACVVEEVPGTYLEFWTECRYWLNRKICGQKTRTRFECCEGFDQVNGEEGCILVKPLKNVLETAEALGATKWARYIRESGLENEFESSGANTLFAPTNEAFDAMSYSLRDQMESYRGNPNNPIIFYHIVPSKLRSEEFDGDQTIESRHQGHNIRINKYSNGMTTINCALLLRKDQEATNGIVHLIDGVLNPNGGLANNVADMILNDGRYQILSEMLQKSGYLNILRTYQDSVTILAPSDEAFQKLPDSRRAKIINDREARLAILQNHVIPHVICESAITGEHKVRTMSRNRLTFNCDYDGVYVESTKLKGNFNLGKNGIIHMIDDVLLPDRAKNLIELAESRSLDTFVKLVKKSGLEDTLANTGDYTFFVPDETAWMEMPPEIVEKLKRDPEYAGLMLRYHGAYGRHLTNKITDNQAIMSLDEEHPVRLQIWRKALGVEDAKITEADIEAQNGVIHIINKVIFPSNQSIQSILRDVEEHSFYTFLYMLDTVTSEPNPKINLRPGEDKFYTFFVPTDRAFNYLGQTELDETMRDREKMRKIVESHVAVNMYPEISFEPSFIYSIDGIGAKFHIKKDLSGELMVNGAKVIKSYNSANGVIYLIDQVELPENSSIYSTVKTSVTTTYDNGRRVSSSKTTYTTHRRRVTTNEDFDEDDLEDILPGYPGSSKIVRSKKRKTTYAIPKTKSGKRYTRRRGKKRFYSKKFSTFKKPDDNEVIDTSSNESIYKVEQPKYEAHESKLEIITRGSITEASSSPPETRNGVETTAFTTLAPETRNGAAFNLHVKQTNNTNFSSTPSLTSSEKNDLFNEEQTIIEGRYNYSGTIYSYPAKLSGSRYDSIFTNNSNASLPSTFGLYYNYTWDGASSQKGLDNIEPLPEVGYRYNQSSYSISSSKNNNSLDSQLNNPFNFKQMSKSYSTLTKFNTIGPVSQSDKKFSYVGHPYGEDVVGHKSNLLPFSSPRDSFVTNNSSSLTSINEVNNSSLENQNLTSKDPLSRKRIMKTHTTYTYPSGKSSTFFTKSTHILQVPQGDDSRIITTNISTKKDPDFVSAYDFTGAQKDFADGSEFSEARSPSEEMITEEQAKILRRQWKRQRQHRKKLRRGRKQHPKRRRKMRKHRKAVTVE